MNKRDKIFIWIIVLTLILAVSAVIFVYFNTRTSTNNEAVNEENASQNQNNKENINNVESVDNISLIQQKAQEKYPNFTWLSKQHLGKFLFSVQYRKVYLGEQEVKFTKGTPKYATGISFGGILTEAIVITETGELYISPNETKSNHSIVTGEEKFEKVELGGKVIDATYTDKHELYFLLDSGKLVNIIGVEYGPNTSIAEMQQKAQEKYPSFTWLSKQNLGKAPFSVYDGKVHLGEQEVKFTKGTPKYATGIIDGGILTEAAVITQTGELYISPNETKGDHSIVTGEEKFEKVELGGKVIDATYADKSELYFLLDSGKLVNLSGQQL